MNLVKAMTLGCALFLMTSPLRAQCPEYADLKQSPEQGASSEVQELRRTVADLQRRVAALERLMASPLTPAASSKLVPAAILKAAPVFLNDEANTYATEQRPAQGWAWSYGTWARDSRDPNQWTVKVTYHRNGRAAWPAQLLVARNDTPPVFKFELVRSDDWKR